jgi:hypothetical protein
VSYHTVEDDRTYIDIYISLTDEKDHPEHFSKVPTLK